MDDSSLHFAQPWLLAAGVAACAGFIALFVRFDRKREADLAKLAHPRFRQRLTEGFSPRLRNVKRVLWLLAVLLLFAAAARPQMGYEWREVKRKGIDILFAVDTSRSMLADDLTPNRLERARIGILDFVAKLQGDRVGLIPFAGSAFALCPLTLDYEAFRESLDALDTDLIPRQGTDLASAIKEAERLFDENGNNHRVLVLLTDGEDLQGDVIGAAKKAAEKGMAIHTIGVGSPEGSTIPLRYPNGRTDFVRDANGEVVRTTLDEATLKKIAEATNALYVPLGRGAEGLDTIYQEKLRLVPQTESEQRMERIPLERYVWPLAGAVAFLLLEFLLADRLRPKKAPVVKSAARRSLVSSAAPLAVFVFVFASGPRGTAAEDMREVYNEGTDAYSKGDFTKASESLRASLRTQDLVLQQKSYYNLGNTLYRTGQGSLEKDPKATIKSWEESIKAYQDALSLNAGDEDARFNKELVEKKLEELKKQQQQQDSKDQKDDSGKKEDQEKQDEKKNQNQDSKDGEPKDPQDSKDDPKKEEGKDSKDGESKDGDPKEGEPKDSKDGKPEDQKKDQKSAGSKPDEEKSDEEKQGKNGKPGEEQEKKEGEESKEGGKPGEEKGQEGKEPQPGEKSGDEKQQDGEPQGEMSNERVQKQEMTPEEAKQMLEALRQDERTVIPIPQQRRTRFLTPDNSTNGKTW